MAEQIQLFDRTKRVLILVESPEKAKTIGKIFRDAGYSRVFVQATIGHFTKLADGAGYYNTGIFPDENFKMNYVIDPAKKEVVSKLKEQVKMADQVYICSDPDREGEAIAWSCVKFLNIPKNKYKRASYQAINQKAIFEAIRNAGDIDMNLVHAAHARSGLDKGFGYRISQLLREFNKGKSGGRCQTPALGMVYDRDMEIANFIPEKYFDLYLHFFKNKVEFKAKYVGTDKNPIKRLDTQEQIDKIFEECKGHPFIVKDIEHKDRLENPRPPFSTVTFQKECASKLGLTIKQAAECAQKLFDAGKISYHRTDATFVSEEFQEETKQFISKRFKDPKLFTKPEEAKKTGLEQEGHECLRILDWELTPEKLQEEGFSSMHVKVYRMIYIRTLQSMLPAAIYSCVQYTIANGKHLFKFETKELKYEGYKMVKNIDVQENDDFE